MRYTYYSGLRSYERALDALEDAYATGDLLPGERPEIEAYPVTLFDGTRAKRFKITCEG